MIQISKKERISLTEIFPGGSNGGEAHDWTPSLFNNEQGILDELSITLGIPLKPLEREYKVVGGSIDILARNELTGNYVIIENQFGDTDDRHFFNIFAKYWNNLKNQQKNVDTIIWIFETCNNWIRQFVIDFNSCHENINVYLVEMIAEIDSQNQNKYISYNVLEPNIESEVVQMNNAIANSGDKEQFKEFWDEWNVTKNEWLFQHVPELENISVTGGWKTIKSPYNELDKIALCIQKTQSRVIYAFDSDKSSSFANHFEEHTKLNCKRVGMKKIQKIDYDCFYFNIPIQLTTDNISNIIKQIQDTLVDIIKELGDTVYIK